MRVEAYYNLHKQCLSYRYPNSHVQSADILLLRDVTFSVQPAGRERVLREKRKNVHAFVRGDLLYVDNPNGDGVQWYAAADYHWPTDGVTEDQVARMKRITYNPYLYDTFVYVDTEQPVKEAGRVLLIGKRVYQVPADL